MNYARPIHFQARFTPTRARENANGNSIQIRKERGKDHLAREGREIDKEANKYGKRHKEEKQIRKETIGKMNTEIQIRKEVD